MKYELAHDTIARQIFDKASTEARTRRKVEREIRERYAAWQQRGARLTRDDLDYFKPHLEQINISKEEAAFLEEGERKLNRGRRNLRLLVIGIIAILSGLVIWANLKSKEARENEKLAVEAQQQDSIKAVKLGLALTEADRQRVMAETNADSARAARQEALIQADISDQERRKALRAQRATEEALNETRSFELAYNAGVGLETAKYSEALALAWSSFKSKPGAHSADALLEVAHPFPNVELYDDKFRPELDFFNTMRYSHNGDYYYLEYEDSISVWQNAPRKLLFKRSVKGYNKTSGLWDELRSIGFSPDDKMLIAYHPDTQERKGWALPSGREVNLKDWSAVALYATVFALDIAPAKDDYRLLFGYGDRVHIFSFKGLMAHQEPDTPDQMELMRELFTDPAPDYYLTSMELEEGDGYFLGTLSPDGQHVVLADDDKQVVRFDASTGARLDGQLFTNYALNAITYPPHGKYIVGLNNSGDVLTWDNALRYRIDSTEIAFPDYLHPDGNQLLGFEKGFVKTWNYTPLWSERWLPTDGEIAAMGIGPKGKSLVYQHQGSVWLQEMNFQGTRRKVTSAKEGSSIFYFSSDEKFLICRNEKEDVFTHQLYRTSDGEELVQFAAYPALTFSPDGQKIYTCDTAGIIRAHSLQKPEAGEVLVDNGYPVERLVVSPKSNYLIAYFAPDGSHRPRVWNLQTGKMEFELSIPAESFKYAFSPDEQYLYMVTTLNSWNEYVSVFDLRTKEITTGLKDPKPGTLTKGYRAQRNYLWPLFLAGRHYVLTEDGLWDVATGLQLESFKMIRENKEKTSLLAADPQGRFTVQAVKNGDQSTIRCFPTILIPRIKNGVLEKGVSK